MEWTKTNSTVVMETMRLQISKLTYIKNVAVILYPYHITLFSKICQNLSFVIGFLNPTRSGRFWPSVAWGWGGASRPAPYNIKTTNDRLMKLGTYIVCLSVDIFSIIMAPAEKCWRQHFYGWVLCQFCLVFNIRDYFFNLS